MAFLAESGTVKYFYLREYFGGGTGRGGLKDWIYITPDDEATVAAANYFDIPYYASVAAGDTIRVIRVTDRNDLTTYVSEFWLTVSNRVGSTITVTLTFSDISLGQIGKADTNAALKALSTSFGYAFLGTTGKQAIWKWDSSVLVATHQADTNEDLYVAPDSGSNGAWVKQQRIITWGFGDVGAPNKLVPLEIRKTYNPISFAGAQYDVPAILAQWGTKTDALGADAALGGGARDAFQFRADIDADGKASLDPFGRSGGISSFGWRALTVIGSKAGDASQSLYSALGSLLAPGATDYNEIGVLNGSVANLGSWRGTVHGSELLLRDGTGTINNSGTAQAGTASTITLASGASAVDDAYKDMAIRTTGGTGSGQYRRIGAYNGTTKVASIVHPWGSALNWGTTPDNTTTYEVFSAFDTYIPNVISRIAKHYAGLREQWNFFADAEGGGEGKVDAQPPTGLFLAAETGLGAWNRGFDLSLATFISQHALRMAEGHKVAWTDGVNTSEIYANVFGGIVLAPANGKVITGYTSSVALGAFAPQVQVHGLDANAAIAAINWSATAGGGTLYLGHSRGAAVPTHGLVSSGDVIATVNAQASDGTDFVSVAQIRAVMAAATGATDLPTKWEFRTTPDGSATIATVLTIGSDGALGMGASADTVIDGNRDHLLRVYTISGLPTATSGKVVQCSDLGGGAGPLAADGTGWIRMGRGGYATVSTDADFTLTTLTSATNIRHTGTLTAARAVTLSTTNARPGAEFVITRTGAGAFNLTIGTGPLASLATSQWVIVKYDGSAWYVAALGNL